MPTAVKLSWKTIPLIAEKLNLKERDLREELDLAINLDEVRYYVEGVKLNGIESPWWNVREDYFLEKFATMPAGIEDRFVKVTPVKD